MMPPPLTLTEGQPAELVTLTVAEYEALHQLALVDVTPTLELGWYEVAAGRKIGAATVGGRQIVVRPKITDLNRLVFLLGYAQRSEIWRDDRVQLTPADELLPALAEAFSRLAARAVEAGLLMGYRTVTDTLPVLRGRMLAGEQVTRLYGMPVPLAVEYDDFTVDIAENRLLLLATLRMLRVPGISEPARRRLQRLRRTLVDVTTPRTRPAWTPSRLNNRYHAALQLAAIVLAAESFEQHVGTLTVTGFMFDMWRIYEDFVTVALSEALPPSGGSCSAQYPMTMDEADEVRMRPDLVWLGPDSTAWAVIDAKYKAERPDGFPDADLYQLLAYCTVLGLGDGHMVYAKGNEPVRSHQVRRAGVTIHCHALDLSSPPEALMAEVGRLADRIDHVASGSAVSGRNPRRRRGSQPRPATP